MLARIRSVDASGGLHLRDVPRSDREARHFHFPKALVEPSTT
jgi:hypothetical protein